MVQGDRREFPHLGIPTRLRGKAKLFGHVKPGEQTTKNKADRIGHSGQLKAAAAAAMSNWEFQQVQRGQQGLPRLAAGVPLLLEVDPALDLDGLRGQLDFEIVGEQPDGFVIVASQDLDLELFLKKVADFVSAARGSAVIASIYGLFDAHSEKRLWAISPWLSELWPRIQDTEIYIVDVGIECTGTGYIADPPELSPRRVDESDKSWARRSARFDEKKVNWSKAREAAYIAWDELKSQREEEVITFVGKHYGGEILSIRDYRSANSPQDSFTMRISISGQGLKDFVQNYPFVFEVVQPEDIELPLGAATSVETGNAHLELDPPDDDAPAVAIIDSGIQEAHRWLAAGVDTATSLCLLPDEDSVADLVRPSGHGTRVAGAVLFGESVPIEGRHRLPFWIQNARVLDGTNRMPHRMFPPLALRAAVLHFRGGPRRTRVFNHSVCSCAPHRRVHMSAWAAEIDALSAEHDVLVIQAAGNIPRIATSPQVGIEGHLAADRPYPAYLDELSSRIANPGQSLNALTVGSVAYGSYEGEGWKSFATRRAEPSSFSRSGLGIWDAIKPDVVEFGGDLLWSPGRETSVAAPAVGKSCYPELLRSTAHSPGPALDRDDVGTSFAAPKVAHIAAHLQALLPEESSQLYRALIVQSARWPDWALELLERYNAEKAQNIRLRARAAQAERTARKKGQVGSPPPATDDATELGLESDVSAVIRRLGFGLPDLDRATGNSEYRVTLISLGRQTLRAGECDVFEVPIPSTLRAPGNDYKVLVEITLSFVAAPRRTRRTTSRYLSVWLDWMTNGRGESRIAFEKRAILEEVHSGPATGTSARTEVNEERANSRSTGSIPWVLGRQDAHGGIHGVARTRGTVQKDWAILRMHELPEVLCVAVRGHKGWSRDPDAQARYSLVVGFEVLKQEVEIYEQVRIALEEIELDG